MSAPCPTFAFRVDLDVGTTAGTRAEALRRALLAALDERNLTARGDAWTFTVTGESAQATDLDRKAIHDWAASRPEVIAVRIGDLFEL